MMMKEEGVTELSHCIIQFDLQACSVRTVHVCASDVFELIDELYLSRYTMYCWKLTWLAIFDGSEGQLYKRIECALYRSS